MTPFDLPNNFILGTATASVQIEGSDTNNSWYRWSRQPGRTADGTDCTIADDHWNRVDEDIDLMTQLHVNGYRMSIEWSRIEPEPGHFDSGAMAHYRDEIEKLIAAGIHPMVTLHHFSNPLWLEDAGAWLNPAVIRQFARYAAHVYTHLGDLVTDWITINEPSVYLTFGHVWGDWPPGDQNILNYFKGARHMIGAHIAAYGNIHELASGQGRPTPRVAAAHHLRVFEPAGGKIVERWICRAFERLFHNVFAEGMATGRLLWPIGCGTPFGQGDFQDYVGINYYTRDMIVFNPGKPLQLFGDTLVKPGAPVNDLGWEIYPEGLFELSQRFYRRFKKPVVITENGTPDRSDAFRTRYIYDHLYQVRKLLDAGVDVRGYYHWSLMDNFEWAEGLGARFGLIEVDYTTQARRIRRSGEFYAEICRNHGVTEAIMEEHLNPIVA
jgi:beta-glucosidase